MSSVPPLPMPPPQAGAPGIPMGGMQPNQALQNPNVSPYPVNPLLQVTQQANSFVQKLREFRDQQQQYHMQKYQSMVQLLDQGIPVDMKELAKHAKNAGLDVNTDGPNTAEILYQKQQEQARQMQTAASNPFVAGTPAGNQISQNASAIQSNAPPPATPPPSMFQQMLQKMGVGNPSVSPQSPFVQAMQSRLQGGQAQAGSEQALKGLMQKAVIDQDPNAMMTVSRFGLAKNYPTDELMEMGRNAGLSTQDTANRLIWMHMGGPQMKQMMYQMAEGMAKYYPNENGAPDLKKAYANVNALFTKGDYVDAPSMDSDTRFKIMDHAHQIAESYGIPLEAANFAAQAQFADPKSAGPLLQAMSQVYNAQSTLGGKAESRQMMQFGQGQMQFMFDKEKFQQELALHQSELNLQINKTLADNYGSTYERAYKMLTDPKFQEGSTQQEKETAVQMLTNALNQTNGLSINVGGRKLHFGAGDLTNDRFFNIIGPSNKYFGRPSLVYKMDPMISALKASQGQTSQGSENGIMSAIKEMLKQNDPHITDQEVAEIADSMMQQKYKWMLPSTMGGGEGLSKSFH